MKEGVNIYCLYGTVMGSTEQICTILSDSLKDTFSKHMVDPEIIVSKNEPGEEIVDKTEIFIFASCVTNNKFRGNVTGFIKNNLERLKNKYNALLLVNAPYEHHNFYIDKFEEEVNLKMNASITTGGLVNVVKHKKLLRYFLHEGLDDFKGEIFGEISMDDINNFSKKIVEDYVAGK
ncbi:MAG: hypothetical protein JXB88_17365 [Spirochaetales bacterium]|nr:hypothetical protein [Spirochaetales bacterium]